ncbi:MAG: TRAP transporter large permease [Deltaproteobacteria bacterium]|nr:TRAP transporter large permease [Deltaproteobacteria bacterium]
MILLFGMMLFFIMVGMELGTAMGLSGMLYILYSWLGPSPIPLSIIPQNFMYGLDSFPLLAVPLFMLAGELMEKGGVTERLVRFARALVGHITGGLANVSVVVNMIMAGMSGSSVADAAATGTILIPAMKKAKYPPAMAAAVIASSATIGPIIPPSIPFVLIGSMTGVSIGRLFLGGAVPGIFMGLMLLVVTYLIARKRKMAKESEFNVKELVVSGRDAVLCLLMPLVVLGTMVFGIATPTEAAGIAVAYALFLGGVIYREFTWQSLLEAARNSAVTTASITFTIAGASVIAWVATAEQVGPKLAQVFLSITDNPLLIIFMINALLLLLGFPLEPIPMIMMLIPILMPVIKQLHIDPVHFIVIFTINIQLALLTPPVGANLFVVTAISKSTILGVSRELIPFLAALLVALVILIIYPPLTLWLPKVLMG